MVNEIVQYNEGVGDVADRHVFVMEHTRSVSLMKIENKGYTSIVVAQKAGGDNTVRIVGAHGYNSDISLRVKDGFTGTIVLQNASFSSDRNVPSIDCGENTDIHILLEGKNTCKGGGIKIPESSRVTFAGNGDMKVQVNSGTYYGIGNDVESKHGVIRFKQDGAISVDVNGVNGTAIGAGKGGQLRIEKGRYDICVNGENGVAVGSIDSPVDLKLLQCDMNIQFDAANGVAIGSVNGHADIKISNTSIALRGSSSRYVAVGTLDGDGSRVDICRAHIDMSLRGDSCIGIGSDHGKAETIIEDANTRITVIGEQSFAIGSRDGRGILSGVNADLNISVKNGINVDVAAAEDDISLINGRYMFMLNNRSIEHKVIEKY